MNWKIDIPADCIVTKKGYELNGRIYFRVTQVLGVIAKHGLAIWYRKVGAARAKQIVETRQALGTKVHKLFELILKGKTFDLDSYEYEIQEDVKMFHIFRKETKLEPEALEQKLYSNEHGFAGTCDYIGKYKTNPEYLKRGYKARFEKSGLAIGDWKTSKAIYKDYWLQLAAYAFAFYELTNIKVDGAFIAQFRNNEIKVEEKTWDELVELYEVFKATLKLYKFVYNKK